MKPERPDAPSTAAASGTEKAYLDKISYETKAAKYNEEMKRYASAVSIIFSLSDNESSLFRWETSLRLQSTDVAATLENVLRFPGGWLEFPSSSSDDEGSSRQMELEYLRRTCLVDCVFLLHTVYDRTAQHGAATRLADLVASEAHCLYALFSQEDMTKLLGTIRASHVALLNSTGEPFAQ